MMVSGENSATDNDEGGDNGGGSLIWYICSKCKQNGIKKSSSYTFRQHSQLLAHRKRVHHHGQLSGKPSDGRTPLKRKLVQKLNGDSIMSTMGSSSSASSSSVILIAPTSSSSSVDPTFREEKRTAGLQKQIETNLEFISSTNCELCPGRGQEGTLSFSANSCLDPYRVDDRDTSSNFCETIQENFDLEHSVWTKYFCILEPGSSSSSSSSSDDLIQYCPVPSRKQPKRRIVIVEPQPRLQLPSSSPIPTLKINELNPPLVKRGRPKKKKRKLIISNQLPVQNNEDCHQTNNKSGVDDKEVIDVNFVGSIDWEDRGVVNVEVAKNQKLFSTTEIPKGRTPYTKILKNFFQPTEDGLSGETKWHSGLGSTGSMELVSCKCSQLVQEGQQKTCYDGTKCSNFNKRRPCPPNCGRSDDDDGQSGSICQNQFFNHSTSHLGSTQDKFRLFIRPKIGVGILTIKRLKPYTLIGEYMGLVCSGEPSKEDLYVLSLAKLRAGWYISSNLCGNFTRYINCCKVRPTCIAFGFVVDGLPRVLLLTRGFVPAGYELTFDYGDMYDVPDPCGCFNCRRARDGIL